MVIPKYAVGTLSGGYMSYLDPDPAMVNADDIAICLSRQPRFQGHTVDKITVAQHSVMVSEHCPEYPLEALLHDAQEAYMMDIPKPLKNLLELEAPGVLSTIEDRLYACIATRFGAYTVIPELVKQVDTAMLFTEKRDQQPFSMEWGWYVEPLACTIEPWPEERAQILFRNRLEALRRK